MKNLLYDFFKAYRFLQLKDLHTLYRITRLESYQAGEILVREGQYFEYAVGIRQGIIRTFMLGPDGKEKTIRLASEGAFTSCHRSLLHGEPSTEFLEVVEDAKVILINTGELKLLMKDNIRLLRLWNKALSNTLDSAIQRIEFFCMLNPEERYRHILEENPTLLQRVPQKYLASYMGVTTVSLSRIKTRITARAAKPK